MSEPIFIVGANRSGTTLVRLVLNAHSHIAIPDELTYFDSRLAGVPIETWDDPPLSRSAYAAFLNQAFHECFSPLRGIDRSAIMNQLLTRPPSLKRPFETALRAWADHHGKRRWGEKTPSNLFYADVILDMFPDAHFIFVVRDPRDGVASMHDVSFFPNDTVFNALSRRKHDVEGRAFLHRHVPPSQRMTLKYESFVRAPERWAKTMCEFLDEPFDPAMLSFHEGAHNFMKEDARTRYNETATQPITKDRVATWTRRLTKRQTAIVEYVCVPILKAFDYRPVQHRLSPAAWMEVAVKQLYWRYQCWRHRHIRHYTVKHPIFARTRSRLRTLRARARQSLG
jgi:hypothetical protein